MISTNIRLYAVKFKNSIEVFITCNLSEVLIKGKKENFQLDFIKVSDSSIPKFRKISKSDLKRFNSYDTKATELLTFFKAI